MASSSFLIVLIILSLSVSSTVATSVTLLKAAKLLLDSGFLSMSLTLQLLSNSVDFESPTATVFAISDPSFLRLGQPSLSLLLHHICPRRLSVDTLTYLPPNTKIPTLLTNYTLTLTASPTSQGFLSINGVIIDPNAFLDDGSVIVYGIDEFFNSSLSVNAPQEPPLTSSVPINAPILPPSPAPSPDWNNYNVEVERGGRGPESFGFVAELLRSKGYSIMAAFLDAQLAGFNRYTRLTVFAPVDEAVEDYGYQRNSTDYSLIFRQHVVPRLLAWQDLVGLEDGTMLPTFDEGFMINVVKYDDVPALNEVPVVAEDMYLSTWLVVHGVNRLLTSLAPAKHDDPVEDLFRDGYVSSVIQSTQSMPHDYGDYH